MMKKLLVLMLVLGMGSLVSAAYMLELDPADNGAAILTGDGNFAAYFVSADKDVNFEMIYQGSLRGITNFTGDLEGILGAGMHLFAEFADGGVPGSQILPNGIVARITAGADFPIVVKLLDATDLSQIGADVVLTPEPMSLALLGLGGLFLRRRK
jgi:hypothetical protein